MIRRFLIALACALLTRAPAHAQMRTGAQMKDFDRVFGLRSNERSTPYALTGVRTSAPGNILFPGETARLSADLQNRTERPIALTATLEIVPYGTRGIPGDIWLPEVVALGKRSSVSFPVDIPPGGSGHLDIALPIGARMGGYGVVVDLGPLGRQFVTSLARTFRPRPERIRFPRFSLDHLPDPVLERLGVQSIREGVEWWLPSDPEAASRWERLDRQLAALQGRKITVMLMVGASPIPSPLGRPRPHLTDDSTMTSSKADMAWLPQHDPAFAAWTEQVCRRYGWPRGPLTAMSLWNEPWEGLSISGWGADLLRYRELYRAMARGVLAARKGGAQVLLAGADSSANTLDKFFSDGTTTFLPILDAVTIHYQGMQSPAVNRLFRERKSPQGRVKIWDTESWVANTDDRVAAVVATNRAAGYDRSMGIYGGNIADDGAAWSLAASVGAMQHLLGERPFRRLLFPQGLPWVYVFDGLKGDPYDGTVVIVGDIGEAFGHENVLHRGVRTLGKRDIGGVRQGTLTLPASRDWSLTDFTGNPVAAGGSRIVVPLDHRGFFLRASGRPGSFARLLAALARADIRGFEPVELVPTDFTAPLTRRPDLSVRVTNVLNRPVTGTLRARVDGLSFAPRSGIVLRPGETRTIGLRRTGGVARPANTYPATVAFEAGADGVAIRTETLHANVIARRTIAVDGRLDDWQGALPQVLSARGAAQSVTEQAWLPMVSFDRRVGTGLASGYVAADDRYFYFAAKIADGTVDAGTVRMATRDDSAYFYPAVSYASDPDATLAWRLARDRAPDDGTAPEGTRSYWEDTDTNLSTAYDLDLPTDRKTQVALYAGPWENHEDDAFGIRAIVTDRATGKLLDERHVGRLWKGAYLVWNLSGAVRIRVRPVGDWYTAKVAGLFFDPARSEQTFVAVDLDTSGRWKGVYGASGVALAGVAPQLPAGVTLTMPTEVKRTAFPWPAGVRRFSYRTWPELPVGHFNPSYDNVQLAFNVLPESAKSTITQLPGVPVHFTGYHDTDYEYALNRVAARYGGGTEIWRLQVPGMPRKHFYPRQPRSPFDGPARGGKLVVRHEDGMRIVECALPWSEIPAVAAARKAGRPIKFSFLVNDAQGAGAMELGQGRSVAKRNPSFHVDWADHWANELEFGWGR
jgi:hypothetical protein